MKFLDDVKITKKIDSFNEIGEDDLNFLELSGRKSFWSQGYYGQDIIVAVIDTGVAPHEEFEDRLLKGVNLNSHYHGNKSYYDDNMHGTHCAGSIAGKNVGIAPKARILPIKVLDSSGDAEWSDISDGVEYALDYRGPKGEKVDIISMSLSGNDSYEPSRLHSLIKKCIAKDILVVCSAGNTGKVSTRYPACFDEVVCVGAVDIDKKRAEFSTMGNQVDVCQVGVDVLSAYYEGGYITCDGTSMSTPITAGIAALIACKYKQQFGERISERKLYEAMKMYSKDIGIEGVDKEFGAGFACLNPLSTEVKVTLGEKTMCINGQKVELTTPCQIIDGRFMIPFRHLAEATGAFVEYYHTPPKNSAVFRW